MIYVDVAAAVDYPCGVLLFALKYFFNVFSYFFQLQVLPVSSRARQIVESGVDRAWLFWHLWDYLVGYVLIGTCVVTFWRGTWDVVGIEWEKVFEVAEAASTRPDNGSIIDLVRVFL